MEILYNNIRLKLKSLSLLCSAMEAYSWPENECYRYTMASNN